MTAILHNAIQTDDAAWTRTGPFQAGVAASSVPIVLIDADTTVRLWNPAAERIFGCSQQQLIDGAIPIVSFEQRDALPATGRSGIRAIVRMPSDDRRTTDAVGGRLLQALVDACRLMSGAAFCATSLKLGDETNGYYLLHALAGTPEDEPKRGTMPRAAIGFAPLSVHSVGAAAERWHDRSPVGSSIWRERASLESVLALAITGNTGAIRGGIVFGHPDVDLCTTETQRVIVALAESACVAIDQAYLYEAERRASHPPGLLGLIAGLAPPKPSSMPLADSASSRFTDTPATARAALRPVIAKRRDYVPQGNNEAPPIEATPQIEATSGAEASAPDDVTRGPDHIR